VRLGVIGLGRIGSFHDQPLTDLPVVDSLVVTDAVPAVTAEVAARLGAEPADTPAAYVAVSGGIFRDCSVHDFDSIRWVTGREVVEVYATGGNRGDQLFVEACTTSLRLHRPVRMEEVRS
jgi:predicted dehydrogenase